MRRPIHAMALLAAILASPQAMPAGDAMDVAAAGRFAKLALSCIHREYPNKISHVLGGDADVQPPRTLTPVFYGCFDWHSSVHGHWLLARLARDYPDAPFARAARAARHELHRGENRRRAGLPAGSRTHVLRAPLWTGLAAAADCGAAQLGRCRARVVGRPCSRRSKPRPRTASGAWLPKLHYPIRVGEHSQTAFAFGLVRDWSVLRATPRCARSSTSAAELLFGGRGLPAGLRALGRGFPVAVPRRGGPDAAGPGTCRIRRWLGRFLPVIPRTHGDTGSSRASSRIAGTRSSHTSTGST